MSIKLIALDLDGTLLNSDKLISARTLAAIKAAQTKGVKVTIATGRMFSSAEFFGQEIQANAPLICCNGGLVQEMGKAEPLMVRYLASETVKKILSTCHENNWYINWYIGNDILAEEYKEEFYYAYRTTKNMKIKAVGNDFLSYTDKVVQCVARDLDGNIPVITQKLQELCGDSIVLQQNTGTSADITPPGVNKALGLSFLAESLGLTPAEVMACGDADNDLAMLKYAGTAVVPANGLDIAKKLATFHAEANDDDGIAKAIEELVL